MGKCLLNSRNAAYHHQGGRCYYCRVLMWIDDGVSFAKAHGVPQRLARWLQCTAEHLQARRDGGKNAAVNIAAACRLCNHRRHARKSSPTPEAYQQLVRNRMARKRWHDPKVFERGLVAG